MKNEFILLERDRKIALSDDDLMIEVYKGHEPAFAELFNRYKSEVVNYLYRQCGDYGKAEDLTQECFLRVHRNSGTYKGRGKFRGWLLTIATNVNRSSAVKKKEKNKTLSINQDIADKIEGTVKNVENKEAKEIVQTALESLPEEQKEVVVLKHFHGLKFTEISEILDCPVETVKSRMRYGLLKLAELLKGTGYEY
jgi:RNA polymerase sigma-70 factor (ECF subfamily)